MITRKEYMNASLQDQPAMHRAYYGEVVRATNTRVSATLVTRAQEALAKGDTHLNTIPLAQWDFLVRTLRGVDAELKKRGDYLTLGTGVCVLKEAAKLQAEGKI
jgi:hypothetical protein